MVIAAGMALAVALGSAAPAATTGLPPLTEYVGTYEGDPGEKVEIVAGDALFAVLDEAKYPLRSIAPDTFENAAGAAIPFRRDRGAVTGYEEGGVFHRKLSSRVSPEAAALARPRPPGEADPARYVYRPPPDLHDGIPVGDIAQTPLGQETARRLVTGVLDGTWKDVHSILLFQAGRLVLEEYFYGYSADRPHQLRSATKSVVSAVAGVAVAEGALSGAGDPVLPMMRYGAYANPDPRKAAITLGDLLTMRPGLACNDHSSDSPGRETVIDAQPDWVKATLDLPQINAPGSVGFYCSGAVAVVGRMVENATGRPLPDYAQTHLFGPLGIRRGDWSWNYDLSSRNKEYSQIHLRPRDMLKLGLLYAEGGVWQGRRLLPADWVASSLTIQSTVDDTAYGYFWWRPWLRVGTPAGDRRVYVSAAQGNGGQKIFLLPEYNLVAVITAGAYNSESPSNALMTSVVLRKLLSAKTKQFSK